MAFVRKLNDEYYLCRRGLYGGKCRGTLGDTTVYRDWFWIKGKLNLNNIYFPKEIVGKKIRLKVELIKEEDNKETEYSKTLSEGSWSSYNTIVRRHGGYKMIPVPRKQGLELGDEIKVFYKIIKKKESLAH